MTALALQRRLAGSGVTVSSLHPGVVSTEITRSSEDIKVMKLLIKLDSKIRTLQAVLLHTIIRLYTCNCGQYL